LARAPEAPCCCIVDARRLLHSGARAKGEASDAGTDIPVEGAVGPGADSDVSWRNCVGELWRWHGLDDGSVHGRKTAVWQRRGRRVVGVSFQRWLGCVPHDVLYRAWKCMRQISPALAATLSHALQTF
jgi:hypothetical protein